MIYTVALLVTVAAGIQGDTTGPKRLRATRVPDGAVRVDGRLDESAWQSAEFASGFVQREPTEGAPATERTEVAIAYDDDALYVGARMYSRNPRAVRALVTRRDREGSSEQLIVSLDTYRDRRTAYTYSVTPAAVRIDYYHPSDSEDHDHSYDPVWQTKTTIDSLGWTAEMRIPFSQLRFNAGEQVWGINLARSIPAANEVAFWSVMRRDVAGWSSRFGELVGIEGVRASRRAEIVPYVASDATLRPVDDPRDPFARSRKLNARAGADVKMGLGSALTLDATFNPDFGQVEADPAEVNLSAFETFFDERRPFFVEGAALFQTSGPGYFYSRRIGAAPRVVPDADYVDRLTTTTILGAAKVTGRLRSGLSIAALAALTDRETTRFADTARFEEMPGGGEMLVPQQRGRTMVAPRTGYGVLRLQQQFGANASTAGLIVTSLRREMADWSLAAGALAQEAYTGGIDWRLRWDDGGYDWMTYAGASHIAGDPRAIAEIQRSSRRYYQRPDAGYVSYDPLRRSLTGFTGGTSLSKLSGNWRWDIDAQTESPGFELNDVGRTATADDIDLFTNVRYLKTRPGPVFHNWEIRTFTAHGWNYGGIRTLSLIEMSADATLKDFREIDLEVRHQPRAMNDQLTRGGPLMEAGRRWGSWASLESSSGRKTQWTVGVGHDWDELGGRMTFVEPNLSFRPGTQWEVSLEPEYFTGVTSRQYVTTLERPSGSTDTYGQRYVFAKVDRSELAVRLRVNYAMTPDLTVESYAEPFMSSGRFYDFGELREPRSRQLRRYGTNGTAIARHPDGSYTVTEDQPSGTTTFTLENADFDVLSFRSNLVVRWEWRPGSSFYLVWQQDRAEDVGIARPFRLGRLWRTLGARGANVFAVKLTYWLPLH